MKNIINYWPYIVAIALQLTIPNYTLIVLFTILIGAIAVFFIKRNRVLIKSFSLALIIFLVVFIIFRSRVVYMEDVINGLGLPSFLGLILFPVFNALNVTILFFMGYTLGKLFFKKTIEVTP